MENYNFHEIEEKWQKKWEDEKRFVVKNHEEGKENEYVLIEFPYPSGKGLHVGHLRSYTALDAVARKKRLEGKNVLFPMGCDAFGLEAERTAIREHKLPQEIVKRNIQTFKEQLKQIGLSFDWSREINTCDPSYYKWTQWLFIQFFKHGLAEKRETLVNFCKNCGVLANEEVEGGKCCQCHEDVIQKSKSQWILKMTQYADRLAEDLKLTKYQQHIKTSQINWIGKSEGVQVKFEIKQGGSFEIFTTCIETIYGITFMVLAPESDIVKNLKDRIKNLDEVELYIKQTAKKSEFERQELIKEKSGCLLKGITAINPVNGKEIPVYIGDFVLATYGTGAVMAVPAHDQRDFEFAKQRNIPVIQVIEGNISQGALEKQNYLGTGAKLINSAEFTGLTVEEAKIRITEKLINLGVAKKQVNFKMRDWVFSRQRYWGEPIPMINCPHCGWVPVPEKDLPVVLPNVESYEPTKDGESPLSVIEDWVKTTCPKCGAIARRETDTMPGWAGSSWYFMRYCDPNNDKEFASMDSLRAWLPVNIYNGGNEHTTRHLLYARFWNKFFYDIGISPVLEPFETRISQGIILGSNGVKMSKSLGNVVDPREVVKEYGADSLRLWESFIGDYSEMVNWNDNGVKACYKFLNRVWGMQDFLTDGDDYSKELSYNINYTIKKVTNDINEIKFNTAVSSLMTLCNDIYKNKAINTAEFKTLLILLNPFAPHITEELWEKNNFTPMFKDVAWPSYDEKALIKQVINLPVQINGKMRGTVIVSPTDDQNQIIEIIKNDSNISKYLTGSIKKCILVPNRIINIIC